MRPPRPAPLNWRAAWGRRLCKVMLGRLQDGASQRGAGWIVDKRVRPELRSPAKRTPLRPGRHHSDRPFPALAHCIVHSPSLLFPRLASSPQVIGVSVDSQFSHLAWSNTPRKQGGLGGCKYPLVADLTKQIAKDYGVLIEDGPDAGVSLR